MGEIGVQVAAYVEGELVLNDWAGAVSARPGAAAVDGNTLFNVFSVSKAAVATSVHLQVERGDLAYDLPLADLWPEYTARGKERISIRDILTHRAGVPHMPADVTPELATNWEWIVGQLADAAPLFAAPGRETHTTP